MTTTSTSRNIRPTHADRLFQPVMGWLVHRGVNLVGARILAVRGRTSGEWRTTVVNPLSLGDQRFLVAPRGHTQWVRNLRVALDGELRIGRRTERFTASEVADGEKVPVLREYLVRWGWEVGRFFDGLDKHSTDAELLAVAPDFPVFRITSRG